MALGKEAFAEGLALGKDRPSVKIVFAEGRGALGKVGPLGHGGQTPSGFVEGYLGKVFFLKK